MGESVRAAQMIGRVGPKVPQRVPASNRVVAQPARPLAADRDRAVLVPDHYEPDPGMVGEGSISSG